jgi:hypothetical protein
MWAAGFGGGGAWSGRRRTERREKEEKGDLNMDSQVIWRVCWFIL